MPVNPYWYSSKPIHWPSGKYDFLYRWYIPQLDRWPNRDPLGDRGSLVYVNIGIWLRPEPWNVAEQAMMASQFKGLNAFTEVNLNPSLFVANNPVCAIDPDGNNPVVIGILGGIGIGIILYEGYHGLEAACHAQKAADDANAANAKKCLALGEMPTTPPQTPSHFRNLCVSLGLYK